MPERKERERTENGRADVQLQCTLTFREVGKESCHPTWVGESVIMIIWHTVAVQRNFS